MNIGLSTLRIYLSFLVLTSHFFSPKPEIRKYNISRNKAKKTNKNKCARC